MIRNEEFLSTFGKLSNDQWLDVILRSCHERQIAGVTFPQLPDEALQERFVGASGEEAFRRAFPFYREVENYAKAQGIRLNRTARVLDFGCGWGRFYRLFLKDLSTENFLGIDVDPACVKLCRETIPVGQFEQCDMMPPFRSAVDSSLDLIYAYSVLSHLSEGTQLSWIREFARILRPGGLLIATTLKRGHISVWQNLLLQGGDQWKTALTAAGFSVEKADDDFEKGTFLYCGIGGGGVRSAEFYGEAIISPAYVRRFWCPDLEYVDYVSSDTRGEPQAIIVARKPE